MNKDKLKMVIAILAVISILMFSLLVLNQIYNNHKANELIIEKCFENFGKGEGIMIKKDGLWSPVVCEKN